MRRLFDVFVDLTWKLPTDSLTKDQITGSAVESAIQDYCNAHSIDLGLRKVSAAGFGQGTFYLSTFPTGSTSTARITLGGNDWSYFLLNKVLLEQMKILAKIENLLFQMELVM